MTTSHIPVLLDEVVGVLAPARGGAYLDCTVGLGGHAAAVARVMGEGTVVLNDLDAGNLAHAASRVARESPGVWVVTHRGNFAALPYFLEEKELRADMVLADLGFASPQVDDASRGLSFMRDGPLDMRLDTSAKTTAADLVNSLSERDLARIIGEFGEERHAMLVAKRIVSERARSPIKTTTQLADVVRGALRGKYPPGPGIDPATRTVQGLRIAVNDELGSLQALLDAIMRAAAAAKKGAPTWLAPGARVAVISFHSLEDRPVKQAFGEIVAKFGATDLTRKPIVAGEAEVAANPRSRSAKLRAIRV